MLHVYYFIYMYIYIYIYIHKLEYFGIFYLLFKKYLRRKQQ